MKSEHLQIMRMNNAMTTLVGEELEGVGKWGRTLAAPNGSLYGIPAYAPRVAKFNPVDNSMTQIGPELADDDDDDCKWFGGAIKTAASFTVLHVTIVVAFSKLIRTLTRPQNWISSFFQNKVIVCGHQMLPLSMDAFTSCLAWLDVS